MNSKLVPEIQILLEGQKLQDGLTSKVTSAKINYCLEKSDMLQLTFSDDNFEIQNSMFNTYNI
jgi:hypothetical protein